MNTNPLETKDSSERNSLTDKSSSMNEDGKIEPDVPPLPCDSLTMRIDNLYNIPNPFSETTGFVFEHNQIGNNMDVHIYIYDMMGRLVRQLSGQVAGTSTRVEPIRWDGCNSNGESLSNGIYIYHIVATNDKGESATATSKLLICR